MYSCFFKTNPLIQPKLLNRVILTVAISIIFLLIALTVVSQNVGINTTGAAPKTSALLDIDDGGANNKGVLIPRVALADVNTYSPISGVNVESLIIYGSLGTATGSTWLVINESTGAWFGNNYTTAWDCRCVR